MSNSVDINVGAKCTASCKHCCFSCTPDSLECLSDKDIDGILDYIESNKDVTSVSITGGEPLLRFEKVKEIIRRCHDAQKTVSLVTNGFWGKNLENAMSITKELKKSGLDIATLSYDDYHKEYIPPQYISNALMAIKAVNIKAALNITVYKNRHNLNLVEELGEAVFGIQLGIMPVCRAGNSNDIDETSLYVHESNMISKRCPSFRWEIAIHHDGYVYPCCSPMVFETGLRLGNIRKQSLAEIEHNIKTNGLLYIIKREGLMWFVERLGLDLSEKKYVNTCEICKDIFSDSDNILKITPSVVKYYENKIL